MTKKFSNLFSKRDKHEIYPDEIFLDSRNLPDFDVHQFEGRLEKPISGRSIRMMMAGFLLVGLIFFGKLWFLQIHMGQAYEIRSENNHLKHDTIFAERGIIYDRNREELAWNELAPNDDFSKRVYTSLGGFAHLLGYVKYPSKDSSGVYYDEKYHGMDGVEQYYNDELTGQNGLKLTETDVGGNVESQNVLTPPKDGSDLILSIDERVQAELYKIIHDTAIDRGFTGGAGVIMDVHNGEILAITSFPEYDSNVMTSGSDSSAISGFLTDKSNPFLDRVVSGLYIPGSIIKPYIATGVLEEKVIDPLKQILSTGSISIPNPYDSSKKTVFHDWEAHGLIDLRHALSESSDEYFYTVGGGYGDQKGLGIDGIDKYVSLFGFGTDTGIDLEGEKAGNIPSPAWKQDTFNERWYLGDTYNSSIGQYGFQVTPIQAVRAVSAFANGGTLIRPTVLKDNQRNDKYSIVLPFDPNNLQIVREGMRLSAKEGTAKGLNISGFPLAAKTGTAELGITKQFVNSWVMGFFPYDNPRYAFAVLMERGPRSNTIGGVFVMRTLFDWMLSNTPEYTK